MWAVIKVMRHTWFGLAAVILDFLLDRFKLYRKWDGCWQINAHKGRQTHHSVKRLKFLNMIALIFRLGSCAAVCYFNNMSCLLWESVQKITVLVEIGELNMFNFPCAGHRQGSASLSHLAAAFTSLCGHAFSTGAVYLPWFVRKQDGEYVSH